MVPLRFRIIVLCVLCWGTQGDLHSAVFADREWSVSSENVRIDNGYVVANSPDSRGGITATRIDLRPYADGSVTISAAVWAKGADVWLADVISIFDEYGWDWTYHAFREAPCWSLEHEGTSWSDVRPSADNPRKRVVLDGLRR